MDTLLEAIDVCDVDGFCFGNYTDEEAGTGCTVIVAPEGATGGVDVRGGAPASRETDLLRPENTVDKVHAVCLSGGSAFGLEAASGVARELESRGIGLPVGPTQVPIVCSSCIFDLAFGDATVRPDIEAGISAVREALDHTPASLEQGNVGAGTGATVGKLMGPATCMKAGLGAAAVALGPVKVGAVVSVNACGNVVDPFTGEWVAGMRAAADSDQIVDMELAAFAAAGQPPQQKKFETVKDILRKQISSVLYRATSFEDFSDRLMQQYSITVKESRGCLSYLPAGRTKFIRAKHLGDKFDKAAVLATLQANAERKPKAQFKQDTIGKLIDIQSRMTEGKGIGYKRWLTKHNLKVMAQTVKLLQEKDLTDEGALNQRIAELETKYHDALAVMKDLEGRMNANKELRYHIAAYTSTKNVAQQLKTAKRPAAFEEQHRAELTAYRAAAAYFKANDITKLPSPKKLEAEYAQLASEKAKFYEQYKEAKEELLKLKTAKQNVASFFREEEPAQQER